MPSVALVEIATSLDSQELESLVPKVSWVGSPKLDIMVIIDSACWYTMQEEVRRRVEHLPAGLFDSRDFDSWKSHTQELKTFVDDVTDYVDRVMAKCSMKSTARGSLSRTHGTD